LLQADHPLADRASVCFDEVLDFDVVSLHGGTHLHYQMLQAANESGRTFSPRMEVSSYDALCLMVQTGMGIGILPKGSTSAYSMPEMKILRLDEPWAQRELSMCVRNVETLTPAARLLFDHLQREQSAEIPAVNGTAATSS
jgi:DNA-binding transcriptional LysR family regulator